jgi:hypothetical protein
VQADGGNGLSLSDRCERAVSIPLDRSLIRFCVPQVSPTADAERSSRATGRRGRWKG